jgi:hypothetical protein
VTTTASAPAKPLPDHGTYARANGSPGRRERCTCEPCVTELHAVRKRMKVARELGRPCLIDATTTREHIALLHETMSWSAMAAATGCGAGTLLRLYNGTHTQVRRGNQNKIMSVVPPTAAVPTVRIDVTGTRRRIRALQAIGYSYTAIAAAANTERMRIRAIADSPQPAVSKNLADRIANAYRLLASHPAPVNRFTQRSRNRAAAQGWRDPDYWEDVDRIDDPDFDPNATTSRAQQVAEDARWLLDSGLTRDQAAERLGVSRFYVDKALRDHPQDGLVAA